jgi:tetratricopeptide (TPR) repeat protein
MKFFNFSKNIKILCFILLCIALYHSISIAWNSNKAKIDISTEKKCIKEASKLIDRGYPDEASEILRECLDRYSDSSHLISLYGRSLFYEGKLSSSKNQFRKALKKDTNDKEAFEYIKLIKLIEDASENELFAEFKSFIQTKVIEYLSLVIFGVWAYLFGYKKKFSNYYKRKQFKEFLSTKKYNLAVDQLEKLMNNYKKEDLMDRFKLMTKNQNISDQIESLITQYCYNPDLKNKLIYFYRIYNNLNTQK